MHNLTFLSSNHNETAQSEAHGILGTALVQVCHTGPGFGLLATIFGYAHIPMGVTPLKIGPRNISGNLL